MFLCSLDLPPPLIEFRQAPYTVPSTILLDKKNRSKMWSLVVYIDTTIPYQKNAPK